jgi:hypothetical protein
LLDGFIGCFVDWNEQLLQEANSHGLNRIVSCVSQEVQIPRQTNAT